ncbi:MAG: anhydro-N-acetylmuramic acid kinase, partial [Bacteroidales bacterium]|nr:anhydro-N-acetylmuramic acid kinase [Bacteroidales bacterium]
MNHPPLKSHHVIGIMSGTSLDGLDLVYCVFGEEEEGWEYEVRKAVTVPYPEAMSQKLAKAMSLSGYEIALLHNELGRYIGMQVNEFMNGFAEEVELIASHGHTVFHRPDLGMTLQIGSGADISAICRKPTVCDFRTLDVALGGQGAPLVPIGDELLFGQFDICLNLGGISNLSYRADGQRKAYDISPCNIVLNQLAQQMGKAYDAEGNIARSGCIDMPLLEQLNQLEYYQQLGSKSLGREWIDDQFFPILGQCQLSIPDQMRTVCEHIAGQIANACNSVGGKNCDSSDVIGRPEAKTCNTAGSKSDDTTICEAGVGDTTKDKTLLITGGGAHNSFLIDLIRQKFRGQVVIPDDKTIDFKEAIIFAFLGFLRANGLPNCLASVTGARRDSCGGAIYGGTKFMEATAGRSRNNKNHLRDADDYSSTICEDADGYDVSDCVPQSQN